MEMLHYDFMQRAFCAGGIVALLASALGVFLMLRRQALMADTLAHVSLAGVAFGATLRLNPSVTGFVFAIIGAVAIELVRRSYQAFSEMSIAIIMIAGLSMAVVLMSMNQSINKGFSAYLFGSVVAVSAEQLVWMAVACVVCGLYFLAMRRPLYQIAFDEETAETNGLPVKWISFSFSAVTGMIVAVSIPVVGVLLVSSLIILPAALAIRIASRFYAALGIAMLIGLVGVFTGLTASYELDTPPGGTIAIVMLLALGSGMALRHLWRSLRQTRSGRSYHAGPQEEAFESKTIFGRNM